MGTMKRGILFILAAVCLNPLSGARELGTYLRHLWRRCL